MKKFISIALIVLVLAGAALFTFYIWGDDIYSYFAFSDSHVVQVGEDVYRCPNKDYDAFRDYLEADGWELSDQMGAMHLFEKDGEKTAYICHGGDFYTEWRGCEWVGCESD